jgi:hypothetical protein
MRRIVPLAVLAAGMLAAPHGARADSIDGAWCHEKGRRMVISGPSITTPAGTKAEGDYGRHDFAYTVPSGDPGAGTRIRMVLMGEYRVRVQEGDGTPEVWERCGPSTS